jgi:hypothetical protein
MNIEKFRASDDVVAREVGGEMVLLDLVSGTYFGLGAVGSRVWEQLSQGEASLAQLADLIEAEFDAPREVIERDLAELIGQLVDKQLAATAAA